MSNWKNNCKTDLSGVTALVTGASNGIGLETTLALAKLGCKVIMGCRNLEKAELVKKEMIEKSEEKISEDLLVVKCLDLKSKDSIKKFSDDVHQSVDKIQILVNNAGVCSSDKRISDDGFEMTFAVNHLGHFYLTFLLMDILQKSGDDVRIINVSSDAYKMGELIMDDLNLERRGYSYIKSYAHSKLANVLFTKQLTEKYADDKNLKFYSLHPGVVATDLNRDSAFGRFMTKIFKFTMKSSESGAYTTLYCALSNDSLTNGGYFVDCKEASLKDRGKNMEVAGKLWATSCEMMGIDW